MKTLCEKRQGKLLEVRKPARTCVFLKVEHLSLFGHTLLVSSRLLLLLQPMICAPAVLGAAADAPGADAPGGGAADAHVADAIEAAAAGADACPPSLKGGKGGKRADRQPEQERQPEKASGSDGIEPGTLGNGWTMVRVKPAYLGVLLLQLLRC